MSYPEVVYAQSAGWAGPIYPRLDEGSLFVWRDVEWEVAGYFSFPCCETEAALIRRYGTGLNRWVALECPKGCSPDTYAVEAL